MLSRSPSTNPAEKYFRDVKLTTIGEGTKIDNQVMIAHNCRIGRHNLICSQVGIAGSSTTGDYVVLAGRWGYVTMW